MRISDLRTVQFAFCPLAFPLALRVFPIKARLPSRCLQTRFPPFVSHRAMDLTVESNVSRCGYSPGILTSLSLSLSKDHIGLPLIHRNILAYL